jgi:hypothetical protein
MKIKSSTRLVAATLFSGMVGLGLGWWLGRQNADQTTAAAPSQAESQSRSIAIQPKPSLDRSDASSDRSAPNPVDRNHVAKVVTGVFSADTSDLSRLLESIGALTRLSDAEVKVAWSDLEQRPPISEFGSSLAVFFLWTRMNRMGESVAIPKGWGVENFDAAIKLEEARRNLPDLLARLNVGQDLTAEERRAVFTDAMRKDPLDAVKLWRRTTKPEDYHYTAKWFADALSNPQTRSSVMAEVRAWQSKDDVPGVTSALAQNWISRDPTAVEAWLKEPEQADVRDALLWEVTNMRVLTDPVLAWEWSRSLPQQSREHALSMSAAQLANYDPEKGAKLISALTDSAERNTAVESYARTMAANDIQQWEQWRNTLPEPERKLANESAFPLWAYHDVDKAVEWLNSQSAGETKSRMVAQLVNIYAARDPATAATWIETISDRDQRQHAAAAALTIIGTSDLDAIRTILQAMEK